ncbi:hypothetical protein TNCV_3918221 [Trichonephila clavipes]|nr:hypothetical protein TNCV_3918221 [Trichonephila clavipes]
MQQITSKPRIKKSKKNIIIPSTIICLLDTKENRNKMVPPEKSSSDFVLHQDVVKSGSSFAEATIEQRNASVPFQLINKTDTDHMF